MKKTKDNYWILIDLDVVALLKDLDLSVKVLEILREKIPSIVKSINIKDYHLYLITVDRPINNGKLYPAIALSGTSEGLDKLPDVFAIEAQINQYVEAHQEHILALAKTINYIDWPTLERTHWYPSLEE